MEKLYKASRPDGWDFSTGSTFNYARACELGEIITNEFSFDELIEMIKEKMK
jgi:hypothetical protein